MLVVYSVFAVKCQNGSLDPAVSDKRHHALQTKQLHTRGSLVPTRSGTRDHAPETKTPHRRGSLDPTISFKRHHLRKQNSFTGVDL
ncbi:hypothetical protein BaRGS_00009489 [Batillaria attramentaria]|uniref:Secreted protein n=1 Tax=Batillaria attramentaria TaxID=370345 RepID=A0ABD0LIA2_9CAEN